jgi:hypothetical protein
MAVTKSKKIVARVGSYEKDGQTKGVFRTIGYEYTDDNGQRYLRIDRTFNPAGITPKNPTDDSITLSLYELDDDRQAKPAQQTQQRASAPSASTAEHDDIPF